MIKDGHAVLHMKNLAEMLRKQVAISEKMYIMSHPERRRDVKSNSAFIAIDYIGTCYEKL